MNALPTFRDAHEAACGRWASILPHVGVPADALTGKHGPCPGCGGRDRFRFDDKDGRGTFICGGGGNVIAGDGFTLLAHVCGFTDLDALRAVADHLGLKGDAASMARVRQSQETAARHADEAATAHELYVLFDVLDRRVQSRKLARDAKFREQAPWWRPMPDYVWDRERLAARRIHAALEVLYGL
jgi:putative DNA primase/helicase